MDSQELVVISFVFLNFLLLSSYTTASINQESCSETRCRGAFGYLPIRFPFRVVNIQPQSCGYPGFELYCDSFNKTLLNIPNSGNFSVQTIDYRTQGIVLSDPDDCLPKKFLSGLDLSRSSFTQNHFNNNVSFYNCSINKENYTSYHNYWLQHTVSCLSTVPNYAIVWMNEGYDSNLLESWCDLLVGNVSAPVDILSKVLNKNLQLSWDKPECGVCEDNIKRCDFSNNNGSNLDTMCIDYNPPIARQGSSRSVRARYAIGFSVGLGVPAIAVSALILWKYVQSRRRSSEENDRGNSVEMASSAG